MDMRWPALVAVLLVSGEARAAEAGRRPKTSDLSFLVGTWKVAATHYDVGDPKAPPRTETGSKVCRYALESEGEPAFIMCENHSIYRSEGATKGAPEAYLEYLNYNPHAESFEKTNLFSSFPVKVIERVAFDPVTRVVEIRGRVEVDRREDSYVEYWRFDADYRAFDREASFNHSSMPMTEFRTILSGRNIREVGEAR